MKKTLLILIAAVLSTLSFQPSAVAQTPVGPLRVNTNTGAIIDQSNFWTANSANLRSAISTVPGRALLDIASPPAERMIRLNANGTATLRSFAEVKSDLSLAISDVSGLQSALDGKLNLTGGTISGNLTVNGTLSANASSLTSMNATQLTSGTLPDARLSNAATATGTYGGPGVALQVQIDSKGRVTNAFGFNLGTLATQNGTYGNATELTTGTLPAARLPNLTLNLSGTLHNTPVTFSGGVGNATLANQAANTFFMGPASGNATTPTWRQPSTADFPGSLSLSISGLTLSGNLSNNGTATFGDAAADDFVATDDDPRFPNLTAATYTAAADNKVVINGDVGDARYGEIYVLNLAADLSSNSTSSVNSSESVTLPSGTYTLTSYFYADTASNTGGINAFFTNTVAPAWVSGRRSFFESATQGQTVFTAPRDVRVATSLTGLGAFCDATIKTAMGDSIAYFNLSASSTIRFYVSQRSATDAANPAILRARTIAVFRRIGN